MGSWVTYCTMYEMYEYILVDSLQFCKFMNTVFYIRHITLSFRKNVIVGILKLIETCLSLYMYMYYNQKAALRGILPSNLDFRPLVDLRVYD